MKDREPICSGDSCHYGVARAEWLHLIDLRHAFVVLAGLSTMDYLSAMVRRLCVMTEKSSSRHSSAGWRDDPIKTTEQDRFQRVCFAQRAADLIRDNHTTESSVVYGLEGAWGSGKSSVIAMIREFIERADGGNWSVVSFTPWATSGTDSLLSEFFACLGGVAPNTKKRQGLREKIAVCADITRPLVAVIPGIGSGLSDASRAFEERLGRPWDVAFTELSKELQLLRKPVLIVVDDIDRLQSSELLDLLKVVRLLGRFPGVDFLLAYDEQTLVETLQDPSRGRVSQSRARDFMEKIVQYPLSMPPLLTGQIIKLLDEGLTDILFSTRGELPSEAGHLQRVLTNVFPNQLTTPRAIARFLAQVREQFRHHESNEINDTDLIIATFLRVQFPDLFSQLQRWKRDLTRSSTERTLPHSHGSEVAEWRELFELAGEKPDRTDAQTLLEFLFPAIKDSYSGRGGAARFCHPLYFDRYIAQAIPEDDIPDKVIVDALSYAAVGRVEELHHLIISSNDERIRLALSKITERYPDTFEGMRSIGFRESVLSVELLAAGMSILGDFREHPTSMASPELQMSYWAANILRLLLNSDPSTEVDPALISCTNIHRRAYIIATASHKTDNLSLEAQRALQAALRRDVERFLPLLIDDLSQGDASSGEVSSPYLYDLVDEVGLLPKLQFLIEYGLANGTFTVEDIAARFVSVSYLMSGSPGHGPSKAYFSGKVFAKLTGIEAISSPYSAEIDWPDISMARRREFAAACIKYSEENQHPSGS